ncbi:hypothetical protein DCE79_08980 [Lysinibacillus sp. 2017]|nr:hypothetical protein DCE79_08980 [Lysinibacillus sp. 2017]TGN36662.1 hypothetical protein E4L99_03685 [Lysinibacillus sp. S2017]
MKDYIVRFPKNHEKEAECLNKSIGKSTIMLFNTAFVVVLSVIVHILHRQFHFLDSYLIVRGITNVTGSMYVIMNILTYIPIVLFAITIWLYKKNHRAQDLLMTLTLTFGSISIIAGGDGLTEYHFSIFMVVAMIANFQKVKYVIISTIIFAIHHLAGYFLFPQLLCGTEDYSFSLLMIHAIFLVMTAVSTSILIAYNRKTESNLEKETELAEHHLHELFMQINKESIRLSELSNQIAQGSNESANSSLNITNALSNFQVNAEQEAQSLKESILENKESMAQLSFIHDRTENVSQQAKQSLLEAAHGKETVQVVSNQMNVITETISSIKQLVEILNSHSQDISSSLTVVHTISEQTKLLALNASIEAARAGEAGKGFSIVASEIRNLATGTQQSVSNMDNVLNGIQTQIKNVATKMEDGMSEIYKGNSVIEKSEHSFETIYNNISILENDIIQIAQATHDVVRQTDRSATLFNAIAEMNEQSVGTVSIITDAAKQQHLATEGLEQIIVDLNTVTQHMKQLTDKMK